MCSSDLYKNAMGTGIGSDTNAANGDITINGGNIFMKGSRTGAVIGNDAGSSFNQNHLGIITINGGNLFIANIANGAAIGSSNQSKSGLVVVNGGNVTIATAFAGSTIGAGAGQKSVAGANGTLIVNGGSIKTMIMANAYPSWGIPDTTPGPYVIDDATITADMVDGNDDPAVLHTVSAVNESLPVTVLLDDGPIFYQGGLHEYVYEASTTTADNFVELTGGDIDYNLYFYTPSGSSFDFV